MLHTKAGREVVIEEPVAPLSPTSWPYSIAESGPGTDLSDPVFNIAVNDEMLRHCVHGLSLLDADVAEFVPTIAAG
jgi:hypothetical protein